MVKNREFKEIKFIEDSPIKGIVKTKFKKFYEMLKPICSHEIKITENLEKGFYHLEIELEGKRYYDGVKEGLLKRIEWGFTFIIQYELSGCYDTCAFSMFTNADQQLDMEIEGLDTLRHFMKSLQKSTIKIWENNNE